MKSIADKPPLARMASLSINKVTIPRKRKPSWLPAILVSLGLWVVIIGVIWSLAG